MSKIGNFFRKVFKLYVGMMLVLIVTATIISLREKLIEIQSNKLNKKISKEYEELQELRAQWNYVNNSGYLQMLVNKYIPELNQKVKQNTIQKLK